MRLNSRIEPSLKYIEKNINKTTDECNANDILRIGNMMLEQSLAHYPVEYLDNVLRRALNRVIEKKKILKRILEAQNDRDSRLMADFGRHGNPKA